MEENRIDISQKMGGSTVSADCLRNSTEAHAYACPAPACPKNGRLDIPKKWKDSYYQKMGGNIFPKNGKLDISRKWEGSVFPKNGRQDWCHPLATCDSPGKPCPCLPMLAAALNKKVCGSIPTLKERGRGTQNRTETVYGIY